MTGMQVGRGPRLPTESQFGSLPVMGCSPVIRKPPHSPVLPPYPDQPARLVRPAEVYPISVEMPRTH